MSKLKHISKRVTPLFLAILIFFVSVNTLQIFGTQSLESGEEGVSRYSYRSSVTVISQSPTYDVIDDFIPFGHFPAMEISFSGETFVIRVLATPQVSSLCVGDLFVFEPTYDNPNGTAGRVVSIESEGNYFVITAMHPESLDEIFEDFEFSDSFYLLLDEEVMGLGYDIDLPQDELGFVSPLAAIGGFQPQVRFGLGYIEIGLQNQIYRGLTLNGSVRWYTPRINANISLRNNRADISINTSAYLNLSASGTVGVDFVVPLLRLPPIPLGKSGISVEVQVGLRFTAQGQVSIVAWCRLDLEFGIVNNDAHAQASFSSGIDFNASARAATSLNVQLRTRLLGIPVYGIQGDIGMGIRTSDTLQARCPMGSCFVFEIFDVLEVSSVRNFGLSRFLAFNYDLAINRASQGHLYFYNGGARTYCPHLHYSSQNPQTSDRPSQWSPHQPNMSLINVFASPIGSGEVVTGFESANSHSITLESHSTFVMHALNNYGWEFVGWFESGELLTRDPSQVFHARQNRIIEARFRPQNRPQQIVEVQFLANGGSGAPPNLTIPIDTNGFINYTIPNIVPTRSGYTFSHWYNGSQNLHGLPDSNWSKLGGTHGWLGGERISWTAQWVRSSAYVADLQRIYNIAETQAIHPNKSVAITIITGIATEYTWVQFDENNFMQGALVYETDSERTWRIDYTPSRFAPHMVQVSANHAYAWDGATSVEFGVSLTTPVIFPRHTNLLPDRRLTYSERLAWINQYNEMGGAFAFELEVVRLINEMRLHNGLDYLIVDDNLMMVSRFYAQTMSQAGIAGLDVGPYGSNGLRRASSNVATTFGASISRSGIAFFQRLRTPEEFLNSFFLSRFISSEIRYIGFGSHLSTNGTNVFHYLILE